MFHAYSSTKPRIIIHGGAGNISRENLPPERQKAYRASLSSILSSSSKLLEEGNSAIDVATHAVTLFEDDPLFNCSKGAVFTRLGTIELEASIMVSHGYRKRGVGCMLLKRVKHPIQLAREMLLRGNDEKGGGAYAHCQLSGEQLEDLAQNWGLELVDPKYFWTRRRYEEHKKGLEKEKQDDERFGVDARVHLEDLKKHMFDDDDPSWDGHEYLPQGTVGAVVLDKFGTICVATSTGGLTNKLAGRIGDTPTIGAGFFAEQWQDEEAGNRMLYAPQPMTSPLDLLSRGHMSQVLSDCLPISAFTSPRLRVSRENRGVSLDSDCKEPSGRLCHAVAMSGTGNGDSFLRVSAVRTAAAMCRYSNSAVSLASAVTQVAGPGGELQRSAGSDWGRTGEGEGGIIGIELVSGVGKVVWDFNCGGLFRAWVDDSGRDRCMIFRDD